MKRTQKRVLGLSGLVLVAAMTVFAATLPAPNVSAAGRTKATDTIRVQVVNDSKTPVADFVSPAENVTVYEPDQRIKFKYENVDTATVSLKYTSEQGEVSVVNDYKTFDFGYAAGEGVFDANLAKFGLGEFEFTITAIGNNGVPDTDSIKITYRIMNAELTDRQKVDGTADLNYSYSTKLVKKVVAKIRKKGSDEVVKEIVTTDGSKTINVPFYEFAKETTDYEIDIYGYGNGDTLVFTTTIAYTFNVTEVPKTGGLFRNLNIAKEDFLITGLIVFFILSVVAFGVVARGRGSRRK